MSSHKTKIIKELKIGDIHGVSQSKIEGYLSMGYRPYLNEKGNIKWLTDAQYAVRMVSEHRHSKHLSKLRLFRRKKSRREQIKDNFFAENWKLILFVFLFLLGILVLCKYQHILF